jgi:hypothetical protein
MSGTKHLTLNISSSGADTFLFETLYRIERVVPDMLLPRIGIPNNRLPSAFPPTRERAFSPFFLVFAYHDPASDALIHSLIKQSAEHLKKVALAEGQNIQNAPPYPNYAVAGTALERMYGHHLPRLTEIRKRIDPEGVMQLAGGWKF